MLARQKLLIGFGVGAAGLALMVASNVMRASAGGMGAACRNNLKNIGTALDLWAAEHQGHYPATLSSLVPGCLASVPPCQGAGQDTYSQSYQVASQRGLRGVVTCSASHSDCARMRQEAEAAVRVWADKHSWHFPDAYPGTLPRCPAGGTLNYSNETWTYTLFCSGHHHSRSGMAPNYPQLTSQQGLIER